MWEIVIASQIEICNQALTKIGAARIVSLDDNVQAARSLNSAWNITLNSLLRARTWRFSIARVQLAALASTPSWGFSYQYQIPSDYIRLVQVNNYIVNLNAAFYVSSDDSPFSLEGNMILTDYAAPLKIRYVKLIQDTNLFDYTFCDALATKLAIQICEELTDSNALKQGLWQEYKQCLSDAIRANAIEVASQSIPDSEWILGRL